MLYLSTYVGSGTKKDPFRPAGIVEGQMWSSIDLRPDPTKVDGVCLFHLPEESLDGRLIKLAEDKSEDLALSSRNILSSKFSLNFISSKGMDNLFEILISDKLFKPLLPHLPNKRYEIYLNGELWFEQPLIQGGVNSDDFNRSNETPIASPWTKNGSGSNFNLTSNQITKPSNSDDVFYYYNATTPNDQFSQATVKALGSNKDGGVACRIGTGGTAQGYVFGCYSPAVEVFKIVAGSFSSIEAWTHTATVNDIYKLDVTGSTLTGTKNGSGVTGSPATDTSLTTGFAGFFSYDPGNSWDDWSGSSSGGGTTDGVLAATSTGTLTGISSSAAASVLASSGTNTSTFIGASFSTAVLSSSGIGTLTGIGASLATGVLNVTNTGVLTGIGNSVAASILSITSVGALTGIGSSLASSVLSVTNVGALNAVGTGIVSSVLSITSTGTALFVGDSLAVGAGILTVSATSTVSFIGASIYAGALSITSTGSLASIGASLSSAEINLAIISSVLFISGEAEPTLVGYLRRYLNDRTTVDNAAEDVLTEAAAVGETPTDSHFETYVRRYSNDNS